jgi:hypothetical protein
MGPPRQGALDNWGPASRFAINGIITIDEFRIHPEFVEFCSSYFEWKPPLIPTLAGSELDSLTARNTPQLEIPLLFSIKPNLTVIPVIFWLSN